MHITYSHHHGFQNGSFRFHPDWVTHFHQEQRMKHGLKKQTNLLQAGKHCLTHNYKESDQTSPYLDACFDIGLCGILVLDRPHTHHEEDGRTTYQVKLDTCIAWNEQNDNLDCDIIIAKLEQWWDNRNYVFFVTIHFSNRFQIYQNGSTARLRPTSNLAIHRDILRKGNASPLTWRMYADAHKPVPHYTAYTKCLFQGCSMCYSPQEGVALRKRPQTTWRRRSPLCTISTLQETNNLFPK